MEWPLEIDVATLSYSQVRKGTVIVDAGRWLALQSIEAVAAEDRLRTRWRELSSGRTIVREVRADEPLEPAPLPRREMQYIYPDGDGYVFLDTETFEQATLSREGVAALMTYVREGEKAAVVWKDGRPVSVEVPALVELTVSHAELVTGQKHAVLETGLRLRVPGDIDPGEVVTVDTRRDVYVGRAAPVSIGPGR